MEIIDKFNVIRKHDFISSTNDINLLINNYLEHYFEFNKFVYHSEYINQFINKIEICSTLYNLVNNITIKKKQYIKNQIKKCEFDFKNLSSLITKFIIQVNTLIKVHNINFDCSKFIIDIFSEPFLLAFITQLNCFDFISEIKSLYILLHSISSDLSSWFNRMLSISLVKNIKIVNGNIPKKYQLLYNIKLINQQILNIKDKFNFTNHKISELYESIATSLENNIKEVISFCSIQEMTEVLKLINNNIKDVHNIKNSLLNYITVNSIKNYKIEDIIKYIINLNKTGFYIENYLSEIFSIEEIVDNFLKYIHNKINTEYSTIYQFVSIFKLNIIANKDIFIDKYHKLLIQRLLSNKTNIDSEEALLKLLCLKFEPRLTYKISKVISDFKKSKNYNYNNILQTITTSYSNWDINYNQGFINLENNNTQLNKMLVEYQQKYEIDFKRKLIWLPQYGEIEISYNNINIIMLPIQFMVLELFDTNQEMKFDDIINQSFFKNYPDKFRKNIVNSLLNGNILEKINNTIYLSESKFISTNFIEIYLNNSNHNETIFASDIAHSRNEIIKCQINHFIKIEPKDKIELYKLIDTNINIFKLNQSLFEEALIDMEKHDYITINENIITKVFY